MEISGRRIITAAESSSTDKRLLIEDTGIEIGGEKRILLVIEQESFPEDRLDRWDWKELARILLNKQSAEAVRQCLERAFASVTH